MRRGLIYGLKKYWSEVFSGDLLILFCSIVLAVTSISSVGFLGDRLKSSMLMQASSMLGADLVLRSTSEIDSEFSKANDEHSEVIVLAKLNKKIYKKVSNLMKEASHLSTEADKKNKEFFAKEATSRGIERITEVGKMSVYDYPWDSMYPMNRFIRWVSLN